MLAPAPLANMDLPAHSFHCHARSLPLAQCLTPGPGQLTPWGWSTASDRFLPQCRFLLSARKRKKSRSSNYIISLDAADTSRHSPHFAGKVRSNFLGTEFVLYNAGDKPGKQQGGELTPEPASVAKHACCAHDAPAAWYSFCPQHDVSAVGQRRSACGLCSSTGVAVSCLQILPVSCLCASCSSPLLFHVAHHVRQAAFLWLEFPVPTFFLLQITTCCS